MTTSNYFSLPNLTIPFTVRQIVDGDQISEATIEWASKLGLLTDPNIRAKYAKTQVGQLASMISPNTQADTIRELSDWYLWFFAFDDYCDNSLLGRDTATLSQICGRLIIIMHQSNAVPNTDPVTIVFSDLWKRITLRASSEQLRRLTDGLYRYFFGLVWESAQRVSDWHCNVSEYLAMRPHTAAVDAWMVLQEIASGHPLNPIDLAHPEVIALFSDLAELAVLNNDIFSYPKEIFNKAETSLSLPVLLRSQKGLSHQEALNQAAEMHNKALERYCLADKNIRSWAAKELCSYLDELHYLIAGMSKWHQESARYTVTQLSKNYSS